MFSLLRTVLIVAAIFYYSPVRQTGEGVVTPDSLFGANSPKDAPHIALSGEPPARLETLWRVLPDSAKAAVIERILSTSALGAGSTPAVDTLDASDRQPAWRSAAKRSAP